jgi:hypothetical protein
MHKKSYPDIRSANSNLAAVVQKRRFLLQLAAISPIIHPEYARFIQHLRHFERQRLPNGSRTGAAMP